MLPTVLHIGVEQGVLGPPTGLFHQNCLKCSTPMHTTVDELVNTVLPAPCRPRASFVQNCLKCSPSFITVTCIDGHHSAHRDHTGRQGGHHSAHRRDRRTDTTLRIDGTDGQTPLCAEDHTGQEDTTLRRGHHGVQDGMLTFINGVQDGMPTFINGAGSGKQASTVCRTV